MTRTTLINWSIEFVPIMLFFGSLSILGETDPGFITATEIFTVATVLALLAAYIRDRRIALFPIIAGSFVMTFGVCTITFHDPNIFIVKDTMYNGLFALALLIGLLRGEGWLKGLFHSLFDMSDEGWRVLSYRWMLAFIILTVSNQLVFMYSSRNIWVMYKLSTTLATIIFGLYQFTLAKKYRNHTASIWGLRIDNN